MRIQSALLASLLLGLYGCQQQASEPQQAAPAAERVAAAVATPAASEPATATVVQPNKPAVVEKVAEPVPAKVEAVAAKAAPAAKAEKPAAPDKAAAPAASVPVKAVEPAKPAAAAETAKPARIEAPAPAPASEPLRPEAVSEADALALAKRNNCLTCHAVDHKVVGPAWKDVAAKYRGDATAEAHLVSKIATGGSGVWGSMKMPAHPKISEAERRTLARFVLNLK